MGSFFHWRVSELGVTPPPLVWPAEAGADGYVDMLGMDQMVPLDKFFARFRRTAYVCKHTKTYVSAAA